jgi:CheY-like chemotaxis protein
MPASPDALSALDCQPTPPGKPCGRNVPSAKFGHQDAMIPAMLSATPPRRLRVLVVDDCPDNRESTRVLLDLWGYEARDAHDGPAALELAQAFRPDVVLLDLGLPKLNGYEVARRLLALPGLSTVNLIAVTGLTAESDRRRADEAGFAFFLVKPFDPAALEGLLRDLAERPKTQAAADLSSVAT